MNPKSLALTFTIIMFVGTIPAANATHTDPLVPDVPVLPNAEPTDDCLPVGVSEEILVRVQQASRGDPAFYRDPLGVPTLCVNGAEEEWRGIIRELNATLEDLRRVTREIQRQVDQRLETTLPDSDLPKELIGPRTVLLNETFNGFRNTGFGDWKVITERGEDPAWEIRSTNTPNGTRYGYRFGDDAGYERGIHQWLVSPEIDMTALKGNQTAVEDVTYARDLARSRAFALCNTMNPPGPDRPPGQGAFYGVCGEGQNPGGLGGSTIPLPPDSPVSSPSVPIVELDMLVQAYTQAFDEHVYSLPVMQHGAFLDLTYRLNLAPNMDGVRLWVYSGDRQPDRSVLFQDDFGVGDAGSTCIHHETRPLLLPQQYTSVENALADDDTRNNDPNDLECSNTLDGGQVISPPANPFPGMGRIDAFSSSDLGGEANRTGFTGEIRDHVKARLNLTPWMEDRIWILFEVKTKSNERGGEFFQDPSMFPHQGDYGFELTHVYAEGEAYHRNFRIKDVAATYPYISNDNPFDDNSTLVRTTVPPGNDPVVVWLHNAGDYWENGTLTLKVRQGGSQVGTYTTTTQLRPDEVKTLRIGWGQLINRNLTEGALYTIEATLDETIPFLNGTSVLEQADTPPGQFPPATEPNATRVQPVNAAEVDELNAGDLQLSQAVRAATLRDIRAVRADGARGIALQMCSLVEGTKCSEHFAGRKGEPREILVGIRNDGNAPQDITVILSASNEGIDKPDIIRDGGTRLLRDVLPGEVRAVQWTVTATDPGAYRLVVSMIREGDVAPKDPNVERRMFVQRSTGLICLDTIDERECGASFVGTLVPELRGQNVTAAIGAPDGTIYVTTEIKNAVKTKHSGQLAALDPATDTWRILANLSATVLNSSFRAIQPGVAHGSIRDIVLGPASELYLVGDNNTILRYDQNGALTRLKVNSTNLYSFTSAVWHNNTLVAGATSGTLAYLDEKGIMQPFLVRRYDTTPTNGIPAPLYTGAIRDMLAAPDGRALAFGDGGVILQRSPAENLTRGWSEALVNGNETLAEKLSNMTLRAAVFHDGQLYVAGDQTLLVSTPPDLFALQAVRLPARVLGPETPRALFSSHEGDLYVIMDADGPAPAANVTTTTTTTENELTVDVAIRNDGVTPYTFAATISLGEINPNTTLVSHERHTRLLLPGQVQTVTVEFPRMEYVGSPNGVRVQVTDATGIVVDGPRWTNATLPTSGTIHPTALNLTAGARYYLEGQHVAFALDRYDGAGNRPDDDVEWRFVLTDPTGTEIFNDNIRIEANEPATYTCTECKTSGVYTGFFYNSGSVSEATQSASDMVQVVPAPPSPTRDPVGASVARCSVCNVVTPDWAYTTPARPAIVTSSGARPAQLAIGVAAGDATFLLGENGHLAPLVRNGEYGNMLDWTTVPSLAPHDGGVLQTRRSNNEWYTAAPQSIILIPDDEGSSLAAKATKFQLSLNHSLNETCQDDCDTTFSTAIKNYHGEVRIVYRSLPDIQVAGVAQPKCSTDDTGPVRAACFHEYVRWPLERFSENSPDGWQYELYRDIAPAQPVADPLNGALSTPMAYLWGVEIFVTQKVAWAIDDIRLQGLVDGTWQDITYWKGPNGNAKGQWFVQDLRNTTLYALTAAGMALNSTPAGPAAGATIYDAKTTAVANAQVKTVLDQADVEAAWEEWEAPFDIDTFSPWHITTQYADRPVFAANNEQYKDGFTEPGAPRLLSLWDSRLVSPVIDLRDAYDPMITFRHAHAFRTQAWVVESGSTETLNVNPSDGGLIEIQYLLQGPDCGSEDESVTCGWSRFYVVEPDGGYPTLDDLGYDSDTVISTGAGMHDGYNAIRNGAAFWGRNAPPDATGFVQSPRDTRTYEEVRVTLDSKHAVCSETELTRVKVGERPPCVPANLTGRQIRVAFHLMTVGNWPSRANTGDIFNASVPMEGNADSKKGVSLPGEGWYVTDFKVLGARTLGIDLRASNLTFPVGYDVDKIGIGPGTRIPVNVTIDNRGTFDVLGYTGRLEVRKVIDSARKISELVDTIVLPQQPTLEAKGASTDPTKGRVNHTLFWNVPAVEGANYSLTFQVDPIGIARDEDHIDNAVTLGTIARPILAKTFERFNVEFRVSPENATTDITRYISMFINNTGNVPLDDFTVERRIVALRSVPDEADTCVEWADHLRTGKLTAIVSCDVWTTARAAPAGTLTPLTVLSDDLDPTADLFWKAPESTNFRVLLSGTTTVAGKAFTDTSDKLVAAYATYFFDDVEGGPRGESMSGRWAPGPGWNVSQPGFRSTDAYSFGDIANDRYFANADASFISPTIDLGSARTATVGFYHDYAFENGFDGGLIELSDDGGKTWTSVAPISDERVSAGYNASIPIQASSVLHSTNDPDDVEYGFTAASSKLPSSVEDWVLTQVDLTSYSNITEPGVEYAGYHYGEIGSYRIEGTAGYVAPAKRVAKSNLYRHDDWCLSGKVAAEGGCWEVENLTEGIKSPVPPRAGQKDNKFWWSGSMSIEDDGLRPLTNNILQFSIPLTGVDEDERVIAEWWEYTPRFASRGVLKEGVENGGPTGPDVDKLLTFHTFHPGGDIPPTYRFNLSAPVVLETQGRWYHMQSDLTSLVELLQEANRPPQMYVGFAYTPHKAYVSAVAGELPAGSDLNALSNDTTNYALDGGGVTSPRLTDDRGFAIDGFNVRTVRFAGGAALGQPTALLTEAQSETRTRAHIADCGVGDDARGSPAANGWAAGSDTYAPCLDRNQGYTIRPLAEALNVPGRAWSIVSAIPGVYSGWYSVAVHDPNGNNASAPPATGLDPFAWYTGELQCASSCSDVKDDCQELAFDGTSQRRNALGQQVPARCVQPSSEARLITPVFDLAAIAGNNAQLSFWHRFAFFQYTAAGKMPLSSGGVVEIQTYDEQAKAWNPWQQLYDGPLTVGATPKIPARDVGRGGYTGVTANTTTSSTGIHHFDPPFESVIPSDRNEPVQFLFTGNSQTIEAASSRPEDGASDGWLREEFDVSKYLGEKVRFGFHYSINAQQASSQRDKMYLDNPDAQTGAGGSSHGPGDKAGWWVTDVSVVGDVIVGKPVQIRLRAGSDGNVHDGHWLVDDMGVFGSRYGDNVGLFVDTTPGKFGALNGTTTTMPITIRNLGDSVRRDLAIEIIKDGKTDVTLSAPGETVTIDGRYYIRNITLGPGQAKTIVLSLTAPKQLGTEPSVTYILTLKEEIPTKPINDEERYISVKGNEVRGFLQREIDFSLQDKPRVSPPRGSIAATSPRLNETVTMVLTTQNTGYAPATLNLSCVARTISTWSAVDHFGTGEETPVVAAEYPCAMSGTLTLAPKEWTNISFTATPTKAGFLQFAVNGSVVNGDNFTNTRKIATVGIAVGVPAATYSVDFSRKDDLGNFTGAAQWSHLRGANQAGSLLIGVNESVAGQTNYANFCGGGVCRVRTGIIDLHNYSASSPAFLSFWHMDRLARHDGWQVRGAYLRNEEKPNQDGSWGDECILRPTRPYEGVVRRILPDQSFTPPTPGDTNPLFDIRPYSQNPAMTVSPRDFFVADTGEWEEAWSLAVFDLTRGCESVKDGKIQPLAGYKIRLEFVAGFGPPMGDAPNANSLPRGPGHGVLIDDLTIGPFALNVRPENGQKAELLDNTTKTFHVMVDNKGATSDIVKLSFDTANSSAPTDSIRVPTEPVTILPGETKAVPVQVTLPRDPSLLPTEFNARVIAKSALDKIASGATNLALVFGPRPWPELSLTVEAPVGLVQEGTETFVPITIENLGLVASPDTRVRVIDEWIGGRSEQTFELSSIESYLDAPEESTRVLEFRWRPEKGSIGVHTLSFVVDPDQLVEQYTRTNDQATLSVVVSDLLIPDLHVAELGALRLRNAVGGTVSPALDADVARYEVTAGELVSFELKVANRGRAGATNVDVRAFIGSLSLPAKTIPYIAPGGEVVVNFNWLAQKGEHEIEFIARSEQVELTTENNRYPGKGVTILTVKGYEIVVDIPTLDLLLEPASEIRVPFSITNNGNAGEDLELRARTPAGLQLMLPREGFFLRAGETYADTARLILAAEAVAGEQFISIDAIARENPMKVATGRAPMRVNASYGGNIAGGFAFGAPPTLTIPIELVNEGNSLEPWTINVQLPAGWSAKETLPAKVVVPAHDRTVYKLQVSMPESTAPGERAIGVKATMANGDTREGAIRATVLPLRAAGVKLSDTPTIPERGSLSIPIIVENKGNIQQPFSVLLTEVPAGVELRVEPSTFDLAPGAKAVAALIVKPNATVEAGTYAITGYTRFDGVIPRSTEGLANVQTLRVPIVRQDLKLAQLEFTPRAELDAGDRVSVKVSVQNRGAAELANVPVHLYVDDVFIDEGTLVTIPAGGRADVTFTWTATKGVHTLTAVVDPYEDTVDADRADNAVSTLASVGVDVPTGGIAAGRADAPFPGVVGLFAALAAALLLTRGYGSWRRERR